LRFAHQIEKPNIDGLECFFGGNSSSSDSSDSKLLSKKSLSFSFFCPFRNIPIGQKMINFHVHRCVVHQPNSVLRESKHFHKPPRTVTEENQKFWKGDATTWWFNL
jgi:hypothetical protein